MVKKLFTRVGFLYVAIVLLMAQSGIITAINLTKPGQRQENNLARQNQSSNRDCERLPGPPGSAEVARSIDYLWSSGEVTSKALAMMLRGDDFAGLKANCMVVWSTSGCGACDKMAPISAQLQKEGYSVYIFKYAEHLSTAKKLKITSFPTIIILEKHIEIKRFVGVTSLEEIKKYLKHDNPDANNIW